MRALVEEWAEAFIGAKNVQGYMRAFLRDGFAGTFYSFKVQLQFCTLDIH